MFDLSACQNRIRFAKLFNEWLKGELARMQAENHPLFTSYDYVESHYRLERLKDFGFRLVDRKIVGTHTNTRIRTTFVIPYKNGEVEGRYFLNFYPCDTKRAVCFTVLENCDIWEYSLKSRIINRFLNEMKNLPGYCKSFDDIEEE